MMDSNCNNCRRSFLKKGLALATGLTIVSSGIKLHASPTDEWTYVAYCLQKCNNDCDFFRDNQCPGCKFIDYSQYCSLQACAKLKNVITCAHCSELYTCDNSFWLENPTRYSEAKQLQDSLKITSADNKKASQQNISIAPNPAQDFLKIHNPKNIKINYVLVSINGTSVKKGTIENSELRIDISDIQPGNYFFQFFRNNNILQTQKLVKIK